MTHPESATMTVEQTGALLGISRRSACRAAAAGQIPTIRLGRRILVPTARLHRLFRLTCDADGAATVGFEERVRRGARDESGGPPPSRRTGAPAHQREFERSDARRQA